MSGQGQSSRRIALAVGLAAVVIGGLFGAHHFMVRMQTQRLSQLKDSEVQLMMDAAHGTGYHRELTTTELLTGCGLAVPPTGWEWVPVDSLRGTGDAEFANVYVSSQPWGLVWQSGDMNERFEDPHYAVRNSNEWSGTFIVAFNGEPIGYQPLPDEFGFLTGSTTGTLSFTIITQNQDWLVALYQMQPCR